jgi:hypothetical protein
LRILVEEIDVIGEVLREIGLDVESLDEGAVVEVEDLKEELDGGVLLELEALADGARCVEQDADSQGEIGLLGEAEDGEGRPAIVEEAEVLTFETGDELALLVGDGKDQVDFVDAEAKGGADVLVLRSCCRLLGGRGGLCCGRLGVRNLSGPLSRGRWCRRRRSLREGPSCTIAGGLEWPARGSRPGSAGDGLTMCWFERGESGSNDPGGGKRSLKTPKLSWNRQELHSGILPE